MHTRPTGGDGSSCAGLLGSMPGGNVRVLGFSAQPDKLTVTPSRWRKAFHTWEINSGPRTETISSGIPKFLKTWVNSSSAVSRAVGNPRRGINLQASEKRSTATRIHVWPADLGKSVTKSTPMCDQGRRGMGRGTSLPTGR